MPPAVVTVRRRGSMRPRLLDLFCGAGGAAMGYHRAGFDVVGVDIDDQPDYPFEFVKFDALAVLTDLVQGDETIMAEGFDAIHASPPCQWSSNLSRGTNHAKRAAGQYVNLIPATRDLLKLTGLPWVIENVQGAEVRRDLTLCGEMFGLEVLRHRYFEIDGFDAATPEHVPHRGRVQGWRHGTYFDGPYFAVYGDGGGKGTMEEWQRAMGIDWTSSRYSIAEAIPPAYTEFVGRQLMSHLAERAA
jgi:site-specific DNA-cytosine methylase